MPFKSKDEKRQYDADYYRRNQGSSGGGGYSVLSETATSFRVRHPSGKAFTVAKAKLGKGTLGKLGSMPKAFAEGGEAPVEQSTEAVVPEALPPTGGQTVDPSAKVLPARVGFWDHVTSAEGAASPLPTADDLEMAKKIFNPVTHAAITREVATEYPTAARVAGAAVGAGLTPGMPYLGGAWGANLAGGLTKDLPAQPKPEAPAQPPPDQAQDAYFEALRGIGMTTPVSGVRAPTLAQPPKADASAAFEADRVATEMQRKAAVEKAQADEALNVSVAEDLEKNRQRFEATLKERNAKADAMMKDISSYKVDPNRYWADASTGQKVVAAISVFLGGFASNGGRNQALDLITKFVDDDIGAQRLELGKKQNQLSMYMEQTKDLRAAEDYLRADKLRQVAAQFAVIGSKFEAGSANALAQKATANLMMKAADLDQRNAEAQYARDNQQAMLSYDNAKFNVQIAAANQAKQAATVASLRDRLIKMPDGTAPRVLRRSEDAKVVNERAMAYREFMASARAMKSFIEKNPHGTLNLGALSTEDRAEAEKLFADFRLSQAQFVKGNASDTENKIIVESSPNPAELKANPRFAMKKLEMGMSAATSGLHNTFAQYTDPLESLVGRPAMTGSVSVSSSVKVPSATTTNLKVPPNPVKVR